MIVVYALAAAYAIFCLVTNPAGPITTPDSIRYLDMWPNYPLGYAFFLKLTGEHGAIIAQPLLYGGASAWLGREIVHCTRSPALAAAVLAGSMALPQVREFHASILSESVFLSLLVILLAAAVRFMRVPSWKTMVALAIITAVAATVRRTGFAFVPVMFVMILLHRRALRGPIGQFFVAALAPLALILGIDQAAVRAIHGSEASSLMGRHMFAKAALIEAPPKQAASTASSASQAEVQRALDDQLEGRLAPIRQMLASAPPHVRAVLSLYYETCLQGGCADEARAATRESSEARQTELMGSAGLARIRRAPWNFLALTWMHYKSLWTVNRLRHPDIAADLNTFLASHRPLPYEELAMALGPDREMAFSGLGIVRYAQYAFSAIAIVTAVLAVLGLIAAGAGYRLPATIGAAAVSAIALHAGLILTALLAAGFTRFLLGLWPALVVALGLAGHAVFTVKIAKKHHEAREGL
jgi:hypothetical protein